MSEIGLLSGSLSATVTVEGLPAVRNIVAIERQVDGTWRVCGSGESDSSGQAQIAVQAQLQSSIYALAVDDWGVAWHPDMVVAVGDLVRPSLFTGWLYRVTASGTLPAEEPVWWNTTTTGPQPIGTATLEAERYYQPISHGPLPVELEQPSDADWQSVVSLLHFEGVAGSSDFFDEAGIVWIPSGSPSISTVQSVFGQSSAFLEGSSRIDSTHEGFNFGTDDYTIEGFIWPNGPSGRAFFSFGQRLVYAASGRWTYFNGANAIMSENVLTGRFQHVALCRAGGVTRLFVDGLTSASYSGESGVAINPGTMRIGWYNSGNVAGGYYDEFRVTKGVARYTANFAPPQLPFPDQ